MNAAFSVLVGQFWAETPAAHWQEPLKIFFTNVGAAAFVFYGHKILHRFKDYIDEKFTDVFEPFEKFEADYEEAAEPLTEKLLTF